MSTNYKYIVDLAANTGKFNSQVDGVKKSIGGIEGMAKKASIAMAGVFTVAAIGAGVKAAIDKIKDFEAALSSLSAITGATGKDLEFYEEAAIRTSKKTLQSATDIVKAYEMVGSASPILLKNKEALAKVTEQAIILSEATGGSLGLEDAIKAVTASMNQFGIKGEEAGKIVNVLAAGSLEGSAGVASITEAMKNVGTVAESSNMTLEQTVAMLEVLGEKQIFGAEAGTQLRGSLLRLKEAGLGYASGQFRVNDAIDDANKKLAALGTEAEKDALKVKIFGAENITVGSIMLANKDKFETLTTAITGTTVALDQQRIQNDNLKGDLAKLSTSWDAFIVGLNSGDGKITKIIRNGMQNITALINLIDSANTTDAEKETERISNESLASIEYFKKELQTALSLIEDINEQKKQTGILIDAEIKKEEEKISRYEAYAKESAAKGATVDADAYTGIVNERKAYIVLLRAEIKAQEDLAIAEQSALSEELATKAAEYKLITANVDKLTLRLKEAVDEENKLLEFVKKASGLDFTKGIEGPAGLTVNNRDVTAGAANTGQIDAMRLFIDTMKEADTIAMVLGGTINNLGYAFIEMARGGAIAWGELAVNMLQSIQSILNGLLAQALGDIIVSALNPAHPANWTTLGAAGLAAAAVGLTAVTAMFAGIPAFADGGIVGGPTMALVGEYPGASSNPEVIAPLSKLKDIIGNAGGFGGEVEFKIKGTELVGVLSNYNRKQNRIR